MTRRTLRRVLLAVVATGVAVALGAAGLVAAWLAGVRVPVASGATWMRIEKVASADASGGPADPFFMLLVGNDYRPGVGGARGDAIHVVGVNPRLGQGTIIDIPRDVCAPVPGAGTTKINTAHSRGGPRLQADVAGAMLGVTVSYAVSVDFAGFQGLVDGVGGVLVDVPFEMNDSDSGANFSPGPVRMSGAQALAFSRDRHDFPRGDIQRSENQGLFLLYALQQLQKETSGPAGELRLLTLVARHAQLDGVGIADLYRLGRVAHGLDASKVRNVVMPVVSGGCSGGLTPSGAAASLFADFADDAVLQAH